MRILIATSASYNAFHGQAIFTKNLAEGLVRRNHDVIVVAGSDRRSGYESVINDVMVKSLNSISLKLINPNAFLALFTQPEMEKIFDSFKPEIVHVQDHYPLSRTAIRISHARGIRLVGTNHFMPENLSAYVPLISKFKPMYSWIMWSWMKGAYNHLDAVIAPSKTAADLLQKQAVIPPVFPISCGANTSVFRSLHDVDQQAWRSRYGIHSDRTVFFFVGRVDREKRLDLFLHAASLLDRSDFDVVIAGRGAEVSALQKLVHTLKLDDKVIFTGFIPDENLPSLLDSIDIFVMPGDAELLSIATIQAMACGKPVIAADAVALPELVENNVNGLLFTPGDASAAARSMAWLMDHPETWRSMGEASRERAKKHSMERILSEYENLYLKVLEQNPTIPSKIKKSHLGMTGSSSTPLSF